MLPGYGHGGGYDNKGIVPAGYVSGSGGPVKNKDDAKKNAMMGAGAHSLSLICLGKVRTNEK